MLRVVLIVFLIAHGLVHVAIWAPKYDPAKAPFDAAHSWLIGDQRALAKVLAFAAAAILVLAGVALWADAGGGGRPQSRDWVFRRPCCLSTSAAGTCSSSPSTSP
jgi:hypothetical protein